MAYVYVRSATPVETSLILRVPGGARMRLPRGDNRSFLRPCSVGPEARNEHHRLAPGVALTPKGTRVTSRSRAAI